METASATAAEHCVIHNIQHEDCDVESWISTALQSHFHVSHCRRTEGKCIGAIY